MLDVAYIEPGRAPRNFRDLWGTDDLEFLSRYDGLAFFRITALGAYCLGASERYVNASPPGRIRLSVMSSLLMNIIDGEPSVEELMTLAAWCVAEAPLSWRLVPQKAISAIERGHKLDDLLTFL
jgi:hypothetical protein